MSDAHAEGTVAPLSQANPGRISTKHRIFRYVWNNPGTRQKYIARALHLSIGNVKVTMGRLRRMPDISRRCPECFSAEQLGGACQNCGFEPSAPVLPIELR